MGKTKKPRKAYRPRATGPMGAMRLQPWKLDATFGPLEKVLDQIEAGVALELSEEGDLVYLAADGHTQFALVDSIRGFAEAYDIARMRFANCPSTEAIHRFVDKVAKDEMLTSDDLHACRRGVTALRSYTAQLSIAALADITRTALIKFSLDDCAAAACGTSTSIDDGQLLSHAGADRRE